MQYPTHQMVGRNTAMIPSKTKEYTKINATAPNLITQATASDIQRKIGD